MRADAVRDARLVGVVLFALCASAWVALWWFGDSPYVHYVHHAHRHAPADGDGWLLPALIFVAGWTLMTVAMMLPTSVPLLVLFARVARARADRARLVALVIGGYLLAWAAFGVVAYAGAVAFRHATAATPWLAANPWALAAGTLLAAGVYQFSALKYRCLDRCRSPFMFVMEHWTGANHARNALALGLRHGAFCVGCCWTLMLLMFPFGAGSLGWMLGLGAVMAAEKNLPIGRRLGRPIGVVLVSLAVVVVLSNGVNPHA